VNDNNNNNYYYRCYVTCSITTIVNSVSEMVKKCIVAMRPNYSDVRPIHDQQLLIKRVVLFQTV